MLSFVLSFGFYKMMLYLFFFSCTNTVDDDIDTSTESTQIEEPTCIEDGENPIPEEAEWIILDGNSDTLFALSDGVLSDSCAMEGGNGFPLERPGTVVGAQVQWGNLPESTAPVPLTFWPDFGSNGYTWDRDNPIATPTRCLSQSNEGEWITYSLPEAIRMEQPLHIFVGYTRPERESGTPSLLPEILQEDHQQSEEPYSSGAWFIGVDDELYYHGMTTPWYTWRIRLAVIYDEPIATEDKPFRQEAMIDGYSRGSWGDFDNDGDDDLMTSGPKLFQNQGDGIFVDISDTALPSEISASGGVWGDFNNDGCLDYFGQGGADILLENTCGFNEEFIFSDVTLLSGILDLQNDRDCNGDGEEEHAPTEGAAWFDLDGDGWIDLYLANYECSSEYDYFQNYDDRLFRNNADGTFSDWTEQTGVPSYNHAGRGVSPIDFDFDGDVDVFVSNYRLDPNFFLRNNADGTLTDRALQTGTQGQAVSGAYGHTIGSVFGDIDNDGHFDLIQGTLAHPFFYWFSDKTRVLMNNGEGIFNDEAEERGIYYRETHSNPTLFDADNDGDLDLFISSIYASRDSDFYINDGNGYFSLSNYESGLVIKNGWGTSASDIDNDGDLDLFARQLFTNHNPSKNWLQIRVVGGIQGGPMDEWGEWKGSNNISAIGANVSIESESFSQIRYVSGGSGTGVQDSLYLHVGLQNDTEATITVWFLGGESVTIGPVEVNQRIWIHEDGSYESGWAPPVGFLPVLE
jgi:hypothetical protein